MRLEAKDPEARILYPYFNGGYTPHAIMADEELGVIKIVGGREAEFPATEKEYLDGLTSRNPLHPDFLIRGKVEIVDEVEHRKRQGKPAVDKPDKKEKKKA